MSLKYFGTDGIRGAFGSAFINPEFANRFGKSITRFAVDTLGFNEPTIIVGRDPRWSGEELAKALIQGIQAEGGNAIFLNIVPTPVVAEVVLQKNAALGVMITASHNPAGDNGLKLFSRNGTKFCEATEAKIESFIDQSTSSYNENDELEVVTENPITAYLQKHKQMLSGLSLQNWKIAIDTANGATCLTTPKLLESLGAQIIHIGNQAKTANINDGVGSEHPEKLAELVLSAECNIGLAHDGDGDRLVVCDELGQLVTGEEILGILALLEKNQGTLSSNTIVTTKQTNMGLDNKLESEGIKVIRTDIGDKYVAEAMRDKQLNIGGENSGHYIFRDHSETGDGMIAALKLLKALQNSEKPLSELRKMIPLFPQLTEALKVSKKIPLEDLPNVSQSIKDLETSFKNEGRILVRYSGTENKLRLLVEAKNAAAAKSGMENLLDSVAKDLHILP